MRPPNSSVHIEMDITEENEDKCNISNSSEKMRACFKIQKMKENDVN